ncbi:MAG: glycosyltransferase [Clostridium sp.]
MADIRFVKYNRTRKEEFQIKTSILEESGLLYVEKKALCQEGAAHICSFEEKSRRLMQQNQSVKLICPEISEDGRTARFVYLRGKTMAELLGEQIAAFQADAEDTWAEHQIDAVKRCMAAIYDIKQEYITDFYITPEFMEVFDATGELKSYFDAGEAGAEILIADQSYATSNIDALFDNMIVTEDGVYALDYEWVYSFPIPMHFVQYRTLLYFYQKYESLMSYKGSEEFLEAFDIDKTMIPVYEKMERGFQEYVHGENQRIYQENFMVETKTVKDMEAVECELAEVKERNERLQAELFENRTALKKGQEVQRLTNNHVANLEAIIENLRHEVDEMGKTLTYLNAHEALYYKVRRKLGRMFNQRYPKGTKKRKVLSYCKNTVLHPAKYLAMYTGKEGKNLIKGDFEIGEDYLKLGKLTFLKPEMPKVSIIIPVYNQIQYTYLCLASILEHTQDVSYEIIIADDVSTDATEHLSEFAENITICRNKENQGFLKNCNQAARAAKGQFIMFLNNDTQVTERWLSALVELIESNPDMGMVGSKLVYPDGRLQEAGGILWSDGSGWNYGRLDDPDKAEYNYVKDVDYISGAAILLPLKLWKQIGGFDERFAPAYCEDSDLAFAVRKAGYRVVYQPLSKVIHFEGISNGTDVNGSGLKRYQVENSEKLKEKWSDEFAKQCVNTGNPNPFRARERSMGKKMILVIDHYVPTFDKDAGSKTTYQYLKMFLKKGYTVKFVGDNYLHEEPYTTALEQMGIEVLYGAEYLTGIWDWLDKNGSEISIAYLNRPHIATKYVDYIEEHTDIKIIYYGHDLHFLREFREYELTGDEAKKRESDYWKSIEFTLMHKAAVSYYPSNVEAEAIRAIDHTIHVKAITAYVYETFLENLNRNFAKREGLVFVGGFAHPPNADAVLWFAKEVFPLIREKLDVTFYIVGSRVTDEISALEQPDNGIIVRGFVTEEELSELYRNCKIVVVPLRYGAGVKGKVVEAIYHGAPIVTTSVGSEGIPGVEDVLLIEDTPERFAQAVIELYTDSTRLLEISEKTQTYIKEHFSVDAVWNVVKEDFESDHTSDRQ